MENREVEIEKADTREEERVLAAVCREAVMDDVWKLVKFGKDPWRTKETMKALVDDDNTPCNTDDDKLRALVDRNFLTNDQAPLEVEADAEEEDAVCGYSTEELEGKVRETLRGTSNRSAPGPDGISYRLIKLVLKKKRKKTASIPE